MLDPPLGKYHLKGILIFDHSHASLVVNPASRSSYKVRLRNWDFVAEKQASRQPFMEWVDADLQLSLKLRPGLGEGNLIGYVIDPEPRPEMYDSRLKPLH